jgi:hypothetical protein
MQNALEQWRLWFDDIDVWGLVQMSRATSMIVGPRRRTRVQGPSWLFRQVTKPDFWKVTVFRNFAPRLAMLDRSSRVCILRLPWLHPTSTCLDAGTVSANDLWKALKRTFRHCEHGESGSNKRAPLSSASQSLDVLSWRLSNAGRSCLLTSLQMDLCMPSLKEIFGC